MFRPRLVNTINWRLQDAFATQKHLKVFYKQKITLNKIKFQLKINSRVGELLSQSSQGHRDGWNFFRAAVAQLLSRLLFSDLLGKIKFVRVPKFQNINTGKMLEIIPAKSYCFKYGAWDLERRGDPASPNTNNAWSLRCSQEPRFIHTGLHLAAFQQLWTFSLLSPYSW